MKGCVMHEWKQELASLLSLSEQGQQATSATLQQHHTSLILFFSEVVIPAFELLRTELLQRQRDATISCSVTPSLTTDLSARFTLYAGAPRIQPPCVSEPVPSEPEQHTKRRGLGFDKV